MFESLADRIDREDAFTFFSHILVGAMAATLWHPVSELPRFPKIVILLLYFIAVMSAYAALKRSKRRKDRETFEDRISLLKTEHENQVAALRAEHEKQIASLDAEIANWRRFWLLQSEMRQIVSSFLKERYKATHQLVMKLSQISDRKTINPNNVISAIAEWSADRRAHIKDALRQLSNSFVKDDFGRPKRPEDQVGDYFKVSFYEVKTDETGEHLAPLWRYYPAEAEPKTGRFNKGEGAAGMAWKEKEIQVCKLGGKDTKFTSKWEGQPANYASMICVPAIEDIPKEKLSEVHGVLTVDTPIRSGYFQDSVPMKQFWAFLMQPICSLIIYGKEVERMRNALGTVIEKMAAAGRKDALRRRSSSGAPK